MDPGALTVVVPVKKDGLERLKQVLEAIGGDIGGNPQIAFNSLETVHFMRWVLLHEDPKYAPVLTLETNYDPPLDAHMDDLLDRGAPALDAIYQCCEGYPQEGTRNRPAVKKYFLEHSLPSAAFYAAYRGYTLKDVRNNTRIRNLIEEYLDDRQAKGSLTGVSPHELHEEIRNYLREQQARDPSLSLDPIHDGMKARRTRLAFLLGVGLVAALLYALLLLWGFRVGIYWPWIPAMLIVLYLAVLRVHEVRDDEDRKWEQPVHKHLMEQEDVFTQNQLTHIVDIKPGRFRLYTLKGVLAAINYLAVNLFNRGYLGQIPTVHFARWVILDDKRLLFYSNYDGSWENYLGDFIDKAAVGLTGVWSNTVGFPKTLLLLGKGARDEQLFKQWTRDHQVPTQVFYSAHRTESVLNIRNNIEIRNHVDRSMNLIEVRQWLARL